MAEPITQPCEGSGCSAHPIGLLRGMCSMCGQTMVVDGLGRALAHDRQDILAMLDRGDFG